LQAHANLAYHLQMIGEFQLAWTILSTALNFSKNSAILLEARAIINMQMSNFAAAFVDISKAIAVWACAIKSLI
jgi:hypothetical protein